MSSSVESTRFETRQFDWLKAKDASDQGVGYILRVDANDGGHQNPPCGDITLSSRCTRIAATLYNEKRSVYIEGIRMRCEYYAWPTSRETPQPYEPLSGKEYAGYIARVYGVMAPFEVPKLMPRKAFPTLYLYEALGYIYEGMATAIVDVDNAVGGVVKNGFHYPAFAVPDDDGSVFPKCNVSTLSRQQRGELIQCGWWWWDPDASASEVCALTGLDAIKLNMSADGESGVKISGTAAMAIYRATDGRRDAFVMTESLATKVKDEYSPIIPPGVQLPIYQAALGHKSIQTHEIRGKKVLVAMLIAVLATLGQASVVLNGTRVNNITDYRNVFGLAEAPEGKYFVGFANGVYIPRWRIGNNSKCGDERCGTQLYPYRCPSPDLDMPCNDENCTGCSECGAKVRGTMCYYVGYTGNNEPRALAWALPQYHGITLSETDAYISRYSRYKPAVGHEPIRPTYRSISGDTMYQGLQISGFVCSVIALIVSIVGLYMAIKQSVKVVHTRKPPEDDAYSELSAVGVEVPEVYTVSQRQDGNWWPCLVCLLVAVVLLVPAYADYDMGLVRQVPNRLVDLNYTLPSACSCSDPDSLISQLTCFVPCESEIKVGSRTLGIHFGIQQNCRAKKLVVLRKLHERQCHYCDQGDASSWCRALKGDCSNDTCWKRVATHGGWQHGCMWGGGSVHRLDYSYDIYDAELCQVLSGEYNYITGLEDGETYAQHIFSTLVGQGTYLKVSIDGREVNYKTTNGEIGSTRAWIVEPEDVNSDGALLSTSYAAQAIWDLRIHSECDSCGGVDINIGLPEFSPVTFDQKCDVQLVFETMQCFSLPEWCNGTYSHHNGQVYYISNGDGMCNGKYVAKGQPTSAPPGMKYGPNCTASTSYASTVLDPQCEIHVYYEEQANITNSTKGRDDLVILEQVSMGLVSTLISILGAILIIAAIVLVVKVVISCAKN